MKYLGIAYGKEFDVDECKVYYDFLKAYNYEVFRTAIKSSIKKSKFMPKINELVEECEKAEFGTKNEVIEYMRVKGYFKTIFEYDKANLFVNRGVIPEWLLEDMRKYYIEMITEQKQLGGQEEKFLQNTQKLLTT